MPIKTEIWRVNNGLQKVNFSSIETEKKLESIIEEDITIIDPNMMVIGRQVLTSFDKIIDLLTIDVEGHLTIIELKRDRTPRDVVAQSLDYASWVQTLTYENIIDIFAKYETTIEFETAFEEFFGTTPPESINEDHQLLILTEMLDNSTERIVNYLSTNYGVTINVIFFQYFQEGENEYLSRSWLIDPTKVAEKTEQRGRKRNKEPWNGRDYYVSFGEGESRSWEDARKYGFISAGGGKWYSGTLSLLTPGARIFTYIPKIGYTGVGEVIESVVPVNKFTVDIDGIQTPILQALLKAVDLGHHSDDPELCEYIVRVKWIKTLSHSDAIKEKGMFANQNSACKLRNRFTIERLTELFSLDELDDENLDFTIEFPLTIRAQHKGKSYSGELLNISGNIRYQEQDYPTPTTAAKVIVTDWKQVNGWSFWRYLNPISGKWKKIGELRT